MITKQKGTYDVSGMDAKKRKYVCDVIDAICEKYNYTYIETPIFESSELFHRSVGETSDIVTKETYDFTDRGNRNITLRPEGTAGVIRSFIENKLYGNMSEPVKVYYNGPMFRYERPQSGRQRQFTQFGFELIGTDDVGSDAEVISLAYNTYKLLGINVKVNINTLGDNESRDNYRKALVEYFEPRINELCEDCKSRLEKNPLRILDCKVESCKKIFENDEVQKVILGDFICPDCKDHFEKVQEYLSALNIKFKVNKLLVRGLDYYNRTVFEIKSNNLGSQNAVCGGGRYDSLVETLGGVSTPAVGWAMGMERLYSLITKVDAKRLDAFVVSENMTETFKIVDELRTNGISVEFDYANRKFKKQIEKASKTAKYAIILMEDEIKSNTVTIKNLDTSEQIKVQRSELLSKLNSF